MNKAPRSVMALMIAIMLCAMLAVPAITFAASAKERPLTSQTFIEIAKKVRPAVVSVKMNVETLEKMEQMQRERRARPGQPPQQKRSLPPDADVPDWLREFFEGMPMPQTPPHQGMDPELFQHPYGAGTGFIIRPEGYIVTNRHVVANPFTGAVGGENPGITIVLSDGREFRGKQVQVIAADQLTDVAVLKIEAANLPALSWGDSDKLELGEMVMAIGDPLELTGSVSEGIISGIGRDVEIAGYPQLVQTTAVINPGNSGGPLVNLDGEVVALNMAIATSTRFWGGIGFAIPSNLARKTAEDLIAKGHPIRGYLGIQMLEPEKFPAFAAHEGYKENEGVAVAEVNEGQAAESAGVQAYDIITHINGEKVESNVALQRVITRFNPGDKVTLRVFRDGKSRDVVVTLGDWPSEKEIAALGRSRTPAQGDKEKSAEEPQQKKGRFGLVVEDAPEGKGVVITEVQPDSIASNAQPALQAGDVVLEFEKQAVENAEAFSKMVTQRLDKKAADNDAILLKIRRKERTALVFVPAGEPRQ